MLKNNILGFIVGVAITHKETRKELIKMGNSAINLVNTKINEELNKNKKEVKTNDKKLIEESTN